MGRYIPPPRPTVWTGLLVATAGSAVFLVGLSLFNLLFRGAP
ncbi:hypothetical protein [Psychromarinibacter sp. S121]